MHIEPFATERFFEQYEFSCRHLLSASDCETTTVAELLALAGVSLDELGAQRLGYTEARGKGSLREQIAEQVGGIAATDVIALSAPEEGIYTSMRALLEPGDDVVVMTPGYDSLSNVARHIGCNVHPWTLRATETGWALDLPALESLLATVRPRLLVINVPHNPTGVHPSRAVLTRIIESAAAVGAWVFCDEMYRGLELAPDARLPCGASLYDKCIALGGMSKAYGLPGLRAGWLVVRDRSLQERIVNWKHYTTICGPGPTQWLTEVALRVGDRLTARCRERIRTNLSLAETFFAARADRLVWRAPDAGSIALVQTHLPDAGPLCHRLATRDGVVLLPGACMKAPPSFFRIGLGRSAFAEGLQALGEALDRDGLAQPGDNTNG